MNPIIPPSRVLGDWRSRCQLAASILSWREPNSLTGVLAMKALQGFTVEQLMGVERGIKADEAGAA